MDEESLDIEEGSAESVCNSGKGALTVILAPDGVCTDDTEGYSETVGANKLG